MPYPPPVLPITRTNADPQQDTHPNDHNAIGQAVNDITGHLTGTVDVVTGALNYLRYNPQRKILTYGPQSIPVGVNSLFADSQGGDPFITTMDNVNWYSIRNTVIVVTGSWRFSGGTGGIVGFALEGATFGIARCQMVTPVDGAEIALPIAGCVALPAGDNFHLAATRTQDAGTLQSSDIWITEIQQYA